MLYTYADGHDKRHELSGFDVAIRNAPGYFDANDDTRIDLLLYFVTFRPMGFKIAIRRQLRFIWLPVFLTVTRFDFS